MPGSHPSRGGGPVPQVQILRCEPYRLGPAARYRLSIAIGSFRISNLIVLEQAGESWTQLPTSPKLKDGKSMPRKGGGIITEPTIEIPDEDIKRRFDAAVKASLDLYLSNQE